MFEFVEFNNELTKEAIVEVCYYL